MSDVLEPIPAGRTASRRFILFCGVVPAILTTILLAFRPSFLTQLDSRAYDMLLRSYRPAAPDGRVAVVDIDDRSLATIGQWPWRRDVIAQLVTKLRAAGASVIAFDVVFAEPDRHNDPSTVSKTDIALTESLKEGGVVLGYAFTFAETDSGGRSCVLHPSPLAVVEASGASAPPFFRAVGAVCNLPPIAEAAGASGFLNAVADPDGILRRIPLFIEYQGRVYPGLALAAVQMAHPTTELTLRTVNEHSAALQFGDRQVPLDGRSNLLINYRGAGREFPYMSANAVIQGKAPPGMFKDAIVFVGATALGTREVVATPYDSRFAGVEVHATVADNLLRGSFLSRPENAAVVEMTMTLAIGIAVTLLAVRVGLSLAALGGLLMLVGVALVSRWELAAKGEYFSPIAPLLGMVTSLAASTVAKLTQERGRADRAVTDRETARRLMVRSLLSLTEARDPDTGRHSRRIQQYCRVLAEELATRPGYREYLTTERIDLLSSLAPLHDIGKVGVSDELLKKPGQYTAAEFDEMKKHPIYGLDVITRAQYDAGAKDDAVLALAKEIVYTHHEWWDGSGYPRGLKGDEIPISGRIVALVDVYDAITARRVYREPLSHERAIEVIGASAGTHFDPVVVEAFVRVAPRLELLAKYGAPSF